MREMQTFARAAEFADPAIAPNGRLEAKLREMRFHMVDVCKLSSLERVETRALAHGPFLELLRDQGIERASRGSTITPTTSASARRSTCRSGSADPEPIRTGRRRSSREERQNAGLSQQLPRR